MLARAFSMMLLTAMASDGWAATRKQNEANPEKLRWNASRVRGQVNVDDLLRITVKGNPALSVRCRVDPTGGIDYPYVGHLIVRGLKPAEVGTLIANRLKDADISVTPVSVVIEAQQKGPGAATVEVEAELLEYEEQRRWCTYRPGARLHGMGKAPWARFKVTSPNLAGRSFGVLFKCGPREDLLRPLRAGTGRLFVLGLPRDFLEGKYSEIENCFDPVSLRPRWPLPDR